MGKSNDWGTLFEMISVLLSTLSDPVCFGESCGGVMGQERLWLEVRVVGDMNDLMLFSETL